MIRIRILLLITIAAILPSYAQQAGVGVLPPSSCTPTFSSGTLTWQNAATGSSIGGACNTYAYTLTANVTTASPAANPAAMTTGQNYTVALTQGGSQFTFVWPTGFLNPPNVGNLGTGKLVTCSWNWNGTNGTLIGCTTTDTAFCSTTAAPAGNPVSGVLYDWCDSASGRRMTRDSSGNILGGVLDIAATAGQFITSIVNGVPVKSAPTAHGISVPLVCAAASASGTAYTCTTSPSFTPAAGDAILFKADVANTGSATLNVNSTSAATIKKQGGGTNLIANDLLAGQDSLFEFDGTNWQMQGQTGNAGAGAGTVTTSGSPASPQLSKFSSATAITTATASDISAEQYVSGGGTAQAQTATLSPAVGSLTTGLYVCWLPAAANTSAAPTLAVNGLAAKPITKLGTTALVANDLATAAVACAIYDGTEFQLQNPQTTASSVTTGGAVTSTTPVTVNANSTSEQFLMELALGAGFLNNLGQPFVFNGAGVYSTAAAQTPTLTIKVKLCTVSGCGSGTVVTLATIVSTATIAAVTNNNWNLTFIGYTALAGASGTMEIHGPLAVDLGALTTTADSIFNDVNTAASSAIDLSAALFVDFSITFSTNGASSNSFTQRSGGVIPFAAPASTPATITTKLVCNVADAYTVVAADWGKQLYSQDASNCIFTIPQAGTTGFESGKYFDLKNESTGVIASVSTTSTFDNGDVTKFIGIGGTMRFTSDGTNWHTSGTNAPIPFFRNWAQSLSNMLTADTGSYSPPSTTGTPGTGTQASSDTAFPLASFTIPANFFATNHQLRIEMYFTLTTSGSPPNLTLKSKFNGTAVAANAATSPGPSLTNRQVGIILLCSGTAALSGSASIECDFQTNGASSNLFNLGQIQGAAIATNAAIPVTFTAIWSAATAGNWIQARSIRVEGIPY